MTRKAKQKSSHCYVACIGASAGGLEALERFFKNCKPKMGVAYVVVQHLSSNYKSMMDDLIHRYTQIPVSMIEQDMQIEPDHIYLIPAGTTITVQERNFVVAQKEDHTLTLPIDIFMQSLAEDIQQKAIAVILSGTGSDGSRGAQAVNASGGFVLAQTPDDAKFDGMPQNLIATGIVDDVLPVNEIPARIEKYLHNPLVTKSDQTPAIKEARVDTIGAILEHLKLEHDIDFKEYKSATVLRRIERRMQVKHIADVSSYLRLLENDLTESTALRRELLIPVTSFFRDELVFDYLAKKVIPGLVVKADPGDGIRVWIAGCSTGEEAYSIAMLLLNECVRAKKWLPIKVFATDVNPEAVDFAAMGRYPDTISTEVPEDLLTRYFRHEDGHYTITTELRQVIVFARHNLLVDAPFTNMDLVSCRNTLIYFSGKAQSIALQKLQYANKVGGYLLLGKSETLVHGVHNYATLDSRLKVFRCSQRERLTPIGGLNPGRILQGSRNSLKDQTIETRLSGVIREGESTLKNLYLPPCLLINEKYEIVHIYRDASEYIHLKEGPINFSLNQVLPDTLVPVVSALIHRVRKMGASVSSDKVQFTPANKDAAVSVIVEGMPIIEGEDNAHILLIFKPVVEEVSHEEQPETAKLSVHEENTQRLRQLEQELTATRESLQSTIEELETTNEELQATNEELMASNEELQSSNEELQSVNEELNTVNAEYHEKMNILNRINSDLEAMSKASGIATIFLDQNLQLSRFTPDALEIFSLRDSDIGRPLEDIVHNLDYPELFDDIRKSLLTGRMLERETSSQDGRSFMVRVVNYTLSQQGSAGVVISFIDVSAFKTSEQLQLIIDALPEHIAVVDRVGRIVKVNAAWEQFSMANGDEELAKTGVGTNYLKVCGSDDSDETATQAQKGIKGVLEGSLPSYSLEYPCHSPDEERWFAMEVVPVKHEVFAAVVSHFNITNWRAKTHS